MAVLVVSRSPSLVVSTRWLVANAVASVVGSLLAVALFTDVTVTSALLVGLPAGACVVIVALVRGADAPGPALAPRATLAPMSRPAPTPARVVVDERAPRTGDRLFVECGGGRAGTRGRP